MNSAGGGGLWETLLNPLQMVWLELRVWLELGVTGRGQQGLQVEGCDPMPH